LQNLPVDALKIDRSFTAKLDTSPTAVSMIRSVIAMGRTLGLRVVTEGVESEGQLGVISELGSDEVQGFFTGQPAPAETAMALAMAHSVNRLIAVPARMVTAGHNAPMQTRPERWSDAYHAS
jgi:EAL domain-containing protein (putative c-di-GMP-specific phosphodiesterase class I)